MTAVFKAFGKTLDWSGVLIIWSFTAAKFSISILSLKGFVGRLKVTGLPFQRSDDEKNETYAPNCKMFIDTVQQNFS